MPHAPVDAPAPVIGRPPDWWVSLNDEQLLDVRMCDLGVTIEGSKLEAAIAELHAEADARNLAFKPHYWLSDEWFTPDGVGGIAIPFYLAHPRLEQLEEHQMLEVEGGTHDWCVKILRHEYGHAIDNAYTLQRRRKRLKLFGPSTAEYPEYYTPSPTARASSCTSTPGTRRAIPTRTSPRRSRCGSTRTRSGASATPTGRP